MINSQRLIICCLLFAAVLGGEKEPTPEESEKYQKHWLEVLVAGLSEAKSKLLGETDLDPVDDWINLPENIKRTVFWAFPNCVNLHVKILGGDKNGVRKCAMQTCRRVVRNQYLFCRKGWVNKEKDRKEIDKLYENGEFLAFFASVDVKYKQKKVSGEAFQKLVLDSLHFYRKRNPSDSKATMWGEAYQIFARDCREEKKAYLNYFEECLDYYCNMQQTEMKLKDSKELPAKLKDLALGPFEMYLELSELTPDSGVDKIAAVCAFTAFMETVVNQAENYIYLLEDDVELLNKYFCIISTPKVWDFFAPFYTKIEGKKGLLSKKPSKEKLREILVDLLNNAPECKYAGESSSSSSQTGASTSTG